jgi:hypothetical protein
MSAEEEDEEWREERSDGDEVAVVDASDDGVDCGASAKNRDELAKRSSKDAKAVATAADKGDTGKPRLVLPYLLAP